MNYSIKSLLAAGVLSAVGVASTANAALITRAGVSFDPNSGVSFAAARIYEKTVTTVGEHLVGHGVVSTISGDGTDLWVAGDNDVELTFVFDYTVTAIDPITGTAQFDNGIVNFYTQNTTDPGYTAFNWGDKTNSEDGDIWLNLAGHTLAGVDLNGSAHAIGPHTGGSAFGLLDVAAGSGVANIDWDLDGVDDGNGGSADASFFSSYDTTTAIGNPTYDLGGTASLTFQNVPEPASLVLLAFGGLFMTKRRK